MVTEDDPNILFKDILSSTVPSSKSLVSYKKKKKKSLVSKDFLHEDKGSVCSN